MSNITIPLKFNKEDTIYTIKQVKFKNICPICKGTGIIKYKNKDMKCPECMGKGELISDKQTSIVVDEPFKIKSVKINMGDNHIRSIRYRGTCGLNEFNRAEGNLFFTKEEAQQRCDELNKERMTIDIKDIDIPKDFRNSKPSIDKIKRKLDYYKNNNKFDKDIIIDRDRVLQDGYITYLLCKMFNVNNIDVIVQDIKSNIKNDTVPTTPKKKRPRPGFY
ncbi:MAG: hypothetical protein LIR50_03815 [Bacillota bacterium]|nr:hypothetical protein [Bacillota bacterium]